MQVVLMNLSGSCNNTSNGSITITAGGNQGEIINGSSNGCTVGDYTNRSTATASSTSGTKRRQRRQRHLQELYAGAAHGGETYLQNLYAGAHHDDGDDHMHGADAYLEELYAGAHHDDGDDHMHGADAYLQNLYAGAHHDDAYLEELRFSLKRAFNKTKKALTSTTAKKVYKNIGKDVVTVAKNPIVQKAAIAAVMAELQLI